MALKIRRITNLWSSNNISWIFSIVPSEAKSIRRLDHSVSLVLVQYQRDSVNRFLTIQIKAPESP